MLMGPTVIVQLPNAGPTAAGIDPPVTTNWDGVHEESTEPHVPPIVGIAANENPAPIVEIRSVSVVIVAALAALFWSVIVIVVVPFCTAAENALLPPMVLTVSGTLPVPE